MSYTNLRTIHHRDGAPAAKHLLAARLTSEAAVVWPFPVGSDRLFCLLTPELSALLESLHLAERSIDRLWHELPVSAIKHYLLTLLSEEIVSTNAIEGVHTSRREVEIALTSRGPATQRKPRFDELIRLLESLANRTTTAPSTPDEIRQLYDKVIADDVVPAELPDGKLFRAGPVSVYSSSQREIHRGAYPETAISDQLAVMIAAPSTIPGPRLLHAVMAHFMFESIHPFYDGNGRMGRLLLGIDLSSILSPATALRLSRTIAGRTGDYYRAFQVTEDPLNHGDGTPFATTLLGTIHSAQNDLIDELRDKRRALDVLEDNLPSLKIGRTDPVTSAILHMLGQVRLFGSADGALLTEITDYAGKSTATTRSRLTELEAAGHVETTSLKPLRFRLTTTACDTLFEDIPR